MAQRAAKSVRWWIALVAAVIVLSSIDLALGQWTPQPDRLPEQYSAPYLQLVAQHLRHERGVTAVIGDSVLWGYHIDEPETAAALLRQRFPSNNIRNFSYEGGSPPNSAVLLRYLVAMHVPIRAVIFNINQKEFSAADSAYRTLHPALGLAASNVLDAADRTHLDDRTTIDDRSVLDKVIENTWRLYRLRVDIREALFHHDDAASAALAFVHTVTGETGREAALHRPTPDRFLGTYDLAPLTGDNTGVVYLRELFDELCAAHIRALGFLTPTNHELLHDYVDTAEYDANLQYVLSMKRCNTLIVLNLDRALPGSAFLDNDHLTPGGNKHLARLLAPAVRKLLQ